MPPQNSANPAPSSPNPQYDFIINADAGAKPGKRFGAPKLPKVLLIVVGGFVLVLVIAIGLGFLNRANKPNTQPYLDVLARSQEIVRVGELAKTNVKDADTLALLTTTNTALASENNQITAYVVSLGEIVDPKLLTGYKDASVDTELEKADQNGNLEETYLIYLKGALSGYLQSLRTAHSTAGPLGKPIMADAITSTENLLKSPSFLASAQQ